MALNTYLYIGNDTQIDVTGLQNADDSSYLNSATVTVTVKDLAGSEVSGVSWPVTLSYESASNGNYTGAIDKDISIIESATYFVEITAAESGLDAFWRIQAVAQYRES
jgi:hypothetical protein